MPTKTTKKAFVKSSGVSKTTSKKTSVSKTSGTKKDVSIEKSSATKKAVVKRRKLELTPTRASAVAIASQANRAKKKALIEKLASEDRVLVKNEGSSTKIPSWVWIFFGCSLLLFCISFYQAIIRPQLEEELTEANSDNGVYWVEGDNSVSLGDNNENSNQESNNGEGNKQFVLYNNPEDGVEVVKEFFNRLSAYEFDGAFDLFNPSMQRSSEIKEHFTYFRMNPFISGIEKGSLIASNFKYVDTSAYGKDRYSFDLSYILSSNQEKYEETWEAVIDTSGDEVKIASIVCTTKGCSRHPIFWPESFGLMR